MKEENLFYVGSIASINFITQQENFKMKFMMLPEEMKYVLTIWVSFIASYKCHKLNWGKHFCTCDTIHTCNEILGLFHAFLFPTWQFIPFSWIKSFFLFLLWIFLVSIDMKGRWRSTLTANKKMRFIIFCEWISSFHL